MFQKNDNYLKNANFQKRKISFLKLVFKNQSNLQLSVVKHFSWKLWPLRDRLHLKLK